MEIKDFILEQLNLTMDDLQNSKDRLEAIKIRALNEKGDIRLDGVITKDVIVSNLSTMTSGIENVIDKIKTIINQSE